MKIKNNRYSERVFEAVLRLLPQLSPDAVYQPGNIYGDINLRNIHFSLAELDNKR